MIWRFFKRGSPTTEVVGEEDQSASETASGRAAPRLSTFSFQAISESRAQELAKEGDTAVETPRLSEPAADVTSIVRDKARGRRQFRAADRGVAPVFVPSIREVATCLKLEAEALGLEQASAAQTVWQEYLTLNPRDVEAWFSYGHCAVLIEQDERARQAFQMVIQLEPNHGLAHGALGFVVARMGWLDHAIKHYQAAVNLRPGCLDMLSELARLYERNGQAELAATLWDDIESLSNERVRT